MSKSVITEIVCHDCQNIMVKIAPNFYNCNNCHSTISKCTFCENYIFKLLCWGTTKSEFTPKSITNYPVENLDCYTDSYVYFDPPFTATLDCSSNILIFIMYCEKCDNVNLMST